jgi:hypothetical protein
MDEDVFSIDAGIVAGALWTVERPKDAKDESDF